MVTLTAKMKLDAIENKYYQNQTWKPKVGDYYTLTRNSLGLELFQIVGDDEDNFYISLVWLEKDGHTEDATKHKFPKIGFTTEGFGLCRVWTPKWILKTLE